MGRAAAQQQIIGRRAGYSGGYYLGPSAGMHTRRSRYRSNFPTTDTDRPFAISLRIVTPIAGRLQSADDPVAAEQRQPSIFVPRVATYRHRGDVERKRAPLDFGRVNAALG